MNKRILGVDLLIVTGTALVLLFIDYRYSTGILFGFLCSYVNYRMIEHRYRHLNEKSRLIFLRILLSTSVLYVPLLLSFLFPQYMNWLAALIGLLVIKGSIVIDAFVSKE